MMQDQDREYGRAPSPLSWGNVEAMAAQKKKDKVAIAIGVIVLSALAVAELLTLAIALGYFKT